MSSPIVKSAVIQLLGDSYNSLASNLRSTALYKEYTGAKSVLALLQALFDKDNASNCARFCCSLLPPILVTEWKLSENVDSLSSSAVDWMAVKTGKSYGVPVFQGNARKLCEEFHLFFEKERYIVIDKLEALAHQQQDVQLRKQYHALKYHLIVLRSTNFTLRVFQGLTSKLKKDRGFDHQIALSNIPNPDHAILFSTMSECSMGNRLEQAAPPSHSLLILTPNFDKVLMVGYNQVYQEGFLEHANRENVLFSQPANNFYKPGILDPSLDGSMFDHASTFYPLSNVVLLKNEFDCPYAYYDDSLGFKHIDPKKKECKWTGLDYKFPGGEIDSVDGPEGNDGTCIAAAKREFMEELGIDLGVPDDIKNQYIERTGNQVTTFDQTRIKAYGQVIKLENIIKPNSKRANPIESHDHGIKKQFFFYPVILASDADMDVLIQNVQLPTNVSDCDIPAYITHPDWAECVNVSVLNLGKVWDKYKFNPFELLSAETPGNTTSRIRHVIGCLIRLYCADADNATQSFNFPTERGELRALILPFLNQRVPAPATTRDYNHWPLSSETAFCVYDNVDDCSEAEIACKYHIAVKKALEQLRRKEEQKKKKEAEEKQKEAKKKQKTNKMNVFAGFDDDDDDNDEE